MGDASWMLIILNRWVHLSFACLLVGSAFFMAYLVREPIAEAVEPAPALPPMDGFVRVENGGSQLGAVPADHRDLQRDHELARVLEEHPIDATACSDRTCYLGSSSL